MLNLLFKPDETTELRFIDKDDGIIDNFVKKADKTSKSYVKQYNQKYNCYFGVLPRTRPGETKEVSRINACFLDIDKKDFLSLEDKKRWKEIEKALDKEENSELRVERILLEKKAEEKFFPHIKRIEEKGFPAVNLYPTAKVNSGYGFHYYFILDPEETSFEISCNGKGQECKDWREIQEALIELFRGDSVVKDLPRIMRLPNSFNVKAGDRRPCKIEELHPERLYKRKDFLPLLKMYKEYTDRKEKEKQTCREYQAELQQRNPDEFIEAVLQTLRESGSGLFSENKEYIRFLYACKSENIAYEAIDGILQQSGNYDYDRNFKDYEKLEPSKITFGTAYYYAKEANETRLKELLSKKAIFSLTPAKESNIPHVEPKEKKKRGFNTSDFLAIEGNIEENPVVSGLFHRKRISTLFGPPGVGKTKLMFDAINAISRGEKVFNKYQATKGKTVLIETDFDKDDMKFVIKKLENKPLSEGFIGITNDLLEEGEELLIDDPAGQVIIEEIIQVERPDLLIIDSLGLSLKGEENKAKDVEKALKFLKNMATKYDLHILIITHARKGINTPQAKRFLMMDDMIGSSYLQRYCHLILVINYVYDDEGQVDCRGVVSNPKNNFCRNLPPFEYSIEDTIEGNIEIIYDYEKFTQSKPLRERIREEIIYNLNVNPQMTVKQLQDIIKCSKTELEKRLRELVKAGQIEGIGFTRNRVYQILKKPFPSDTHIKEGNSPQTHTDKGKQFPSTQKEKEGKANSNISNNNNNIYILHDKDCVSLPVCSGEGKEIETHIPQGKDTYSLPFPSYWKEIVSHIPQGKDTYSLPLCEIEGKEKEKEGKEKGNNNSIPIFPDIPPPELPPEMLQKTSKVRCLDCEHYDSPVRTKNIKTGKQLLLCKHTNEDLSCKKTVEEERECQYFQEAMPF